MRRLTIPVALILGLAGCERWQECEDSASWRIPLVRHAGNHAGQPARAQAVRGADGSILIHLASEGELAQTEPVLLADQVLTPPALARIDATGRLVATIPSRPVGPMAMRIDAHSQSAVVWFNGDLEVHDPDLAIRWTERLFPADSEASFDYGGPMDAGPSGEVVVQAGGDLVVWEADGTLRFRRAARFLRMLRVSNAGDIVAVADGGADQNLQRYSGTDGTLLSEVSISNCYDPIALRDDGGLLAAWCDAEETAVIEQLDPGGAQLWALDLGPTGEWAEALGGRVTVAGGRDGDVFVRRGEESVTGYLDWSVTRLDGSTGSAISSTHLCSGGALIGADRQGFVIIGYPDEHGESSADIAFFDAPR